MIHFRGVPQVPRRPVLERRQLRQVPQLPAVRLHAGFGRGRRRRHRDAPPGNGTPRGNYSARRRDSAPRSAAKRGGGPAARPLFVFRTCSQSLSGISAVKANTTICRLVLSFLSQFFQSRRHFSSQAKDRSTTHLFGSDYEGVQFIAFHHFHRGSQLALHRSSKGLPGVTPIHQYLLHLPEVVSAPVKHRQSPSPVGDVGGGHVDRVGQSLRVHPRCDA